MQDINESCQTRETIDANEVPITAEQYNEILNIQQMILEMISSKGNTHKILDALCKLAESLLPSSAASIMMKDKTTGALSVESAPSIPEVAYSALSILEPCVNTVLENKPQYVQDTFQDDRWTELSHIAYDFKLCSCWSMPIRDENKNSIGSFALSSFEHRSPSLFHKKLLEIASSLVSIVLKNEANQKRLNMFHIAMESAAEGMVVTNEKNEIIEVNHAFEKIYGYKEVDVLGKNPSIFASEQHNDEFYKTMWECLTETLTWCGEITNKRIDGTLITQWMCVSAIDDEDTDSRYYLAVFTDLSELKKTQNKIDYMAYHDPLTNLYNKTHLEKIVSSKKYRTIILLNVNNFSYINTAYGFKVGDNLLIEISKLLDENFGNDNVHRINSDDFAIVYDGKINIQKQILQIQNYFYNEALDIDGITLNISFCYGACYGDKHILRNASLALKQAKESGKNRSFIFNNNENGFTPNHREAFIESNNLLHKALNDDNIVPFFQGIRDNKTKKISKFEVLARIKQDDKIITPFTFIEPARLSGLLPEITKVMIDKSFKIMASNDYMFSINITEDDLSRNYLKHFLSKKIRQYKIDPKRVILEILEGVSASGKYSQVNQLNSLKNKGFSIAIDDFGTEYSNFERVLDLDIDFLKIDAKYIKDIDINPKSYEITKAIVFFAKNANIPCIAEFVHNEAVQKIIDDLGIDYSQGYYFSEPSISPTA